MAVKYVVETMAINAELARLTVLLENRMKDANNPEREFAFAWMIGELKQVQNTILSHTEVVSDQR